ncbi:hypothetical protein BD64_720 [Bacillus anthracis]|nr:hypothetical protein AS53_1216 [Bacillus anthracis str. Turkey32]AJG65769.1 hypothetical protein BD64_720 [Bacillus anthracis]
MSKKLVKPILNGILFLGVFLFAHTYLKNVSFTRYLLVVIPMLLVGMFGIDLILSILIKKKNSEQGCPKSIPGWLSFINGLCFVV